MLIPYAGVLITYLLLLLFEREAIPVMGFLSRTEVVFLSIILLVGLYFCVCAQSSEGSGSVTNVFQKSYDLMFRTDRNSLAINDRKFNPDLVELLKQVIDKGMSFYVPANANYHRLLNQRRIGDGHPFILYSILRGRRVGPIGDTALYSDKISRSPCMALWESHKDLIVTTDIGFDDLVIRCLTAPGSDYEEFLFNDREINPSLGVLFGKLRGFRFFVYGDRFEKILNRMN
jgi:hypothetical protein